MYPFICMWLQASIYKGRPYVGKYVVLPSDAFYAKRKKKFNIDSLMLRLDVMYL